MNKAKILWVDDEVEFLQPHILFLREKGYEVETASNAEDGLELIKQQQFDLVLLDEMMPGKDGLTALVDIKKISPGLPVIMITKNEEESLMEDAIGAQINDYLTKPVNPSQILIAAKKLLESRDISQKKFTRDYTQELNKINVQLMSRLEPQDWIAMYLKLSTWDVELDAVSDKELREIIHNQRRECNVEFGKYIERNYLDWVNADKDNRPTLSTDIIKKYVYPELVAGKKVAPFRRSTTSASCPPPPRFPGTLFSAAFFPVNWKSVTRKCGQKAKMMITVVIAMRMNFSTITCDYWG